MKHFQQFSFDQRSFAATVIVLKRIKINKKYVFMIIFRFYFPFDVHCSIRIQYTRHAPRTRNFWPVQPLQHGHLRKNFFMLVILNPWPISGH